MARTQARILVSIWADEEFLRLDPGPQRMYLFLLSQPNLNHAGLLPLTIKRWARSSPGVSMDSIRADLVLLQDADYVVIDGDTEELLIRTLVRNDGVWKQPKVMQAMKSDAAEIVSPKLRWRLRQELLRIDVTQLPKEETQKAIAECLTETLETLPDTPPQGYQIPQPEASVYPLAGAGARSSASASSPTSTTSHVPVAPDKPSRKADEVWDAVMQACGVDGNSITSMSRGPYNKAVADLKSVDATPSEIHRRASVYRDRWPEASLTPTALARRWAECDLSPPPRRSETDRILDRAEQRATAAMSGTERKALP